MAFIIGFIIGMVVWHFAGVWIMEQLKGLSGNDKK